MRVVILHHHLNPGGVIRIIETQIKAIPKHYGKPVVIVGDAPSDHVMDGCDLIVEPCLNYLNMDNQTQDFSSKLGEIENSLDQHLRPDDIIHAHNLNLGKNPLLTLALRDLIEAGRPVFNHCHDFAEDRPKNIKFIREVVETRFNRNVSDTLYPVRDNCLYGALTSFDQRRLVHFGIPKKNVVFLPNPVHFPKIDDPRSLDKIRDGICDTLNLDRNKKIVTYPVRVINRKNIGELILLAAMFADSANWLVTQPPKNPVEMEEYQKWKDFCAENKIGLVFEAGQHVDFNDLLRASDLCVTTSVREGFGMVYLEPWLFGTPVAGRNIFQVTEDFKKDDITFPSLYDAITLSNGKDFAELDIEAKMIFIKDVASDTTMKKELLDRTPVLRNLIVPVSDEIIRHNQLMIRRHYAIEKYGERLHVAYRKLSQEKRLRV